MESAGRVIFIARDKSKMCLQKPLWSVPRLYSRKDICVFVDRRRFIQLLLSYTLAVWSFLDRVLVVPLAVYLFKNESHTVVLFEMVVDFLTANYWGWNAASSWSTEGNLRKDYWSCQFWQAAWSFGLLSMIILMVR